MNSNQLRDFLKEVNRVFPLPSYWDDGSPFCGRHGLGLDNETGRLHLSIWCYDKDNKLVSWPIVFDEQGDELTKDLLLEVKKMFKKKGVMYD